MFERLGEIYSNHEVYLTDLDHDEVPALFWWFPNQDDYQPPPPADETITEKLERITNSIKATRNEITDILYSADLVAEDKIIRAMEIKQETDSLVRLFRDCERDPEAKSGAAAELLSKCKSSLADLESSIKNMDPLNFAKVMKVEAEFKGGLGSELIPWINNAEKFTTETLEKPRNIVEAQEIEKKCVVFAKDVRAANKKLAKIEELANSLEHNKTTAEQQVEEQKLRFKRIAEVAAKRVESMRDLLIRWQEVTNSADKDNLDFQPLTQFLKCYGIYFQ